MWLGLGNGRNAEIARLNALVASRRDRGGVSRVLLGTQDFQGSTSFSRAVLHRFSVTWRFRAGFGMVFVARGPIFAEEVPEHRDCLVVGGSVAVVRSLKLAV